MKVADFRPEFLRSWVASSSRAYPAWAPPLAFLLPLALISVPLLHWAGLITIHTLWVSIVALLSPAALFALTFRRRIKSVLESLESFYIELPIIWELLQIWEREKFYSPKLRTLAPGRADALKCPEHSASARHRRRDTRELKAWVGEGVSENMPSRAGALRSESDAQVEFELPWRA